MIQTAVRISSDGSETGALLQTYLQSRGVYNGRGPGMVCYGLSTDRRPALNAACQSDKITRMRRMAAAGVNLVPWAIGLEAERLQLPLYARRSRGMGGKDLQPVFQIEEIPWRIAAGWDWFSSVVPIGRELRVWVWRGEVLDTYEKVMDRPAEYKAMGRNFGQGFEFRPTGNVRAASGEAITAAAALGLDFTAIDLIIGKDGIAYVLECNTCPGVIRSGAQVTLGKLADRIATWCEQDCPSYFADGSGGSSAAHLRFRRLGQLRSVDPLKIAKLLKGKR